VFRFNMDQGKREPELGARAGGDAAQARRGLRILMATARYLPDRGGTEVHTHELAERLVAGGNEVTVLSTSHRGPFGREELEGGIRVIRVRAWPPNRDYYLAPALARVIRRGETDIVHCQGYHTFVAPVVMLAALSARIPYVVTLHSGGHSSAFRRAIRPLQAWALRPLLTRARRLIAVSPFEADLFARRLRLPRAALTVIRSGVDLPASPEDDHRPDPPLILSIGRVERYKGHQRVVRALPLLIRAKPGIRLRVVGSGSYEDELRQLATRLGVAPQVEIAPVPGDRRDEMARLLRKGRVVAMLSDYESQGLAIHEALGLGRPLVVSDLPAFGDLRNHANVRTLARGAAPELVAEAILDMLDAPAAPPPTLPTWDECASDVLALYEETLAELR
jgi:glycosyltransferase involved in cell wall biosynthesis